MLRWRIHNRVAFGRHIVVDVDDGGLARLEYVKDLDVRVFNKVRAEGDRVCLDVSERSGSWWEQWGPCSWTDAVTVVCPIRWV